jgi:hypothetical protein
LDLQNAYPTRARLEIKTFKSEQTTLWTTNLDVTAPIIPGLVDLDVNVKAENEGEEVAICIPADPMAVDALRNNDADRKLRTWWVESRNNISNHYRPPGHAGPLLLVFQTVDTTQYSNCYHKGILRDNSFRLSARVLDSVNLGLEVGFRFKKTGDLNFKNSPRLPDAKWIIFIISEKISNIWFRKFAYKVAHVWR